MSDHLIPRVSRYLRSMGIHGTTLKRYRLGIASENLRAQCPDGIDLSIRVDRRRSVEDVRVDRHFMLAAENAGIAVPSGPWLDGDLDGCSLTIRRTVRGNDFTETPASRRPTMRSLGSLLAKLHSADTDQLPTRAYFYSFLFDDSHPRWEAIHYATASLPKSMDVSDVLRQGMSCLQAARADRSLLKDTPIGLIHGDFDPSNTLIRASGPLVLLDWEKSCVSYQVSDVAQAMLHFGYASRSHAADSGVTELLQRYLHVRRLRIDSRAIKAWSRASAASFLMSDAAFLAGSLRARSSTTSRRRRYFKQYCVPLFSYFSSHADLIARSVDLAVTRCSGSAL